MNFTISDLLRLRSNPASAVSSGLFSTSSVTAASGSPYVGTYNSYSPFGSEASDFESSSSCSTTFWTTFFSLFGLLNSPYLFSSSNNSSSIWVSSLYSFSFLRLSSFVTASDIRFSALVKLDRRSKISSFLYVRITC